MRSRALVLCVCLTRLAHAQSQSPDAAAAVGSTAPALDEVVVSARRRDENLQDTPVSVTALGRDELEARSISSLTQVAAFTPNLRVSAGPQGGSSGHYFARGVGQLDFIASTDPGVGIYLDGVYLGRTTGAAFDLLDVERVEVLRGPQGTLFGRNTIGGAVSVVSATPPDEPRAETALTLGERNRREGRVSFGGPLGDGGTVRGDVALLARGEDGWQRRIFDGARFGDERTYAARAALDWQPSDAFDVRATLDATQTRGTADPHFLEAANPARGGRPEFVVSDPATTWSGLWARDDLDVRGASLTATYALPRATLKSITAYRSLDSDTGADFDGSPFPDLDQRVLTRQTQRSEELQLLGTAAGGRLTWLTGVFYLREDVEQSIPLVLYGQALEQHNALENRSAALFAHVTYSITERFGVSGGARSTAEAKQHGFDHYFVRSTGHAPLFPPTVLDDRWRSFTPKLGAEYRLGGDALLYAALSQGFRSGGFNGRPFGVDEFLAYDPEELTTLEVGLKSEWLERRVRLNAAAFTSRYDDIQLTRTTIGASGAPIVVTGNAGEAEIYGLEAELTAAIGERVVLTASVGNLHDRYTRIEPGTAVPPDAELPVAPRWTATAGVQHERALARGVLRSRVDFSYTSRFNYFFDNPALSWEPAHRLWNARVSFAPAASSWELAMFVVNAADEDHGVFREDVLASFGTAIVWPAEPRAWGVEFRYRF
jgi:iron complex outermembrane recepter protein